MGKFILIGAVIGSIIAWLLNVSILAGLVLGAIAGATTYALIAQKSIEPPREGNGPNQTLRLREEQLDIKKERVQTGEVKIHKEVVEDKKTFTVPIKREEMVIELGDEEQYRIPLKEEEVTIRKHPVRLAEVSVSKRQVEEIQQVKKNVKKEIANVEVKGEADIKNET